MKKPKVSVVVPIYNVERYLGKCVSSILMQSYDNLEVILVDDGSPDLCPELCDEWAQKDHRIVVIHKENGGLSDARNAGIDIATGDVICFIDSDDWIEKYTIQLAVDCMRQMNTDVVIWSCSVDVVDSDERLDGQSTVSLDGFCKHGEGYETIIRAGSLALYAWNKLYQMELIRNNNLRFEKGVSLVEDVLFNSQALSSARSVSFIAEVGTHYVQRKRVTLGNAYYPDIFNLLMRSLEANGIIFRAFGAPESVVTGWQEKFGFSSLLQSCRNICYTDKLRRIEKLRELKKLLYSNMAKEILAKYDPCENRHNRIYKFLLQKRLVNLYLILETLRRH